jgi:putative Ca2+/H+ antiporter (TMEM165/GDT1 family)
MSAFYFAFLAVLLAGLGARDQATVAALSQRQGARPGVLLTGIAVSIATATFAAWAGSFAVPLLGAKARLVMVAIALLLAALESLWPFATRRMEEPTASLGALAIVVLAHQLTDAARFLIFALAVATDAPLAAGIGGAAGGAVSLAAAWMLPELFAAPRIRLARRVVGGVLLLLALVVAFRALTG